MSVVDDAADRVARIQYLTDRAYAGEQTGEMAFDALGLVAAECAIPKRFADDVIAGFRLDANGWKPTGTDDLLQYCYHVAGAVGCMMAVVMGVNPEDEETLDRACDLGLAFQLANIARDVAEDAGAGRCYLPSEWLIANGVDKADVMDPRHRKGLEALVARICDLSQVYEQSAKSGVAALPFRSRWAVLAAAGIYGDIARKVKASRGTSLEQRIVTSRRRKLLSLVEAGVQSLGPNKPLPRTDLWRRPFD
jgi:phytoene synthase